MYTSLQKKKKEIPFVTFVALCLISSARLSKHGYLVLRLIISRPVRTEVNRAAYYTYISEGGSKIRPGSLRMKRCTIIPNPRPGVNTDRDDEGSSEEGKL